jgi:hypothetical protein
MTKRAAIVAFWAVVVACAHVPPKENETDVFRVYEPPAGQAVALENGLGPAVCVATNHLRRAGQGLRSSRRAYLVTYRTSPVGLNLHSTAH